MGNSTRWAVTLFRAGGFHSTTALISSSYNELLKSLTIAGAGAGQQVPHSLASHLGPSPCFGISVALQACRCYLPGGGAIPMLAIRSPRVDETRSDTLDSPGERAATQRSGDDLNPEAIAIEPNPRQARQLLLRLGVPSIKPAPHNLQSQPHRPTNPTLWEEV